MKKSSGGACCDNCEHGEPCCDDGHDHGHGHGHGIGHALMHEHLGLPSGVVQPSSMRKSRADGELAAKQTAHKVAASLMRRYGYDNPNSPGVRVMVRSALENEGRRLAGGRDQSAFMDGYMSQAEAIVFRTASSGALSRSTGVMMIAAGAAILIGAGITHWQMSKA